MRGFFYRGMVRGFFYRWTMRIAHKFNWHYAPPIYLEGDTQLWCKWCGFRQTIKKASDSPLRKIGSCTPLEPAYTAIRPEWMNDYEWECAEHVNKLFIKNEFGKYPIEDC